MRLDAEVTFATGNITGQQLCPTKLFSRPDRHWQEAENKKIGMRKAQ